MSTITNGRRFAISGMVSVSSRVTLRWLSPSMSLGNACGLISTSAVAPWRASASDATCASPRAIVVFPVPGGPARTMSPCGSPASIESLRPCCRTSSACARSRSFTSRGTMMASQSRSWCSAGRTCSERTPGGRAERGTSITLPAACRPATESARAPASTRACPPLPRRAPSGPSASASSRAASRTCGRARGGTGSRDRR